MQPTDVAATLAVLNSETRNLLILAYELGSKIENALNRVTTPTAGQALREAGLAYLRSVSNAQLRRDVREARGERSAAHFRTKLNSDLEQIRGHRHQIGGTPRVNGGNGTAHAG